MQFLLDSLCLESEEKEGERRRSVPQDTSQVSPLHYSQNFFFFPFWCNFRKTNCSCKQTCPHHRQILPCHAWEHLSVFMLFSALIFLMNLLMFFHYITHYILTRVSYVEAMFLQPLLIVLWLFLSMNYLKCL